MTRRRMMLRGMSLLLLGFSRSASAQAVLPNAERMKIESLLRSVESMNDATFVRNGQEYDAATAARFLRGKWKANESKIKSARDFITKAASISSTSGKPYLIRFKSGKEMKSSQYLLAELKKLEKKPS